MVPGEHVRQVRRRLAGGEPGMPAEGDWPDVGRTSARAWTLAVERLGSEHETLAAEVRRFPASRWEEQVGTSPDAALGTGVTYVAMIAGLLQHDGYHGGQIGLLRKALRPA